MEWNTLLDMIVPGAILALWADKRRSTQQLEAKIELMATKEEVDRKIQAEVDARKEMAAFDRMHIDQRLDDIREDIKELKDILRGK